MKKILIVLLMGFILCSCYKKNPIDSIITKINNNDYKGTCEIFYDGQEIECHELAIILDEESYKTEIKEEKNNFVKLIHSTIGKANYTIEDSQSLDLNDMYLMITLKYEDVSYRWYLYKSGHLYLNVDEEKYYYKTDENLYSKIQEITKKHTINLQKIMQNEIEK